MVAASLASRIAGTTTVLSAPPPEGPPPISSIARTTDQLVISWPAIAKGVFLEKADDLQPSSTWITLTPSVSQVGSETVATALQHDTEFFRLRSGPSLEDFWSGKDTWISDAGGLGHSFGFHALSIIRGNDALWAYYIHNYRVGGRNKSATGRASSLDGVTWTDDGIVVDVGGAAPWIYQSEAQPYHATGRAEGDGWSASPSLDQPNFLVYGPYATNIPVGQNSAKFELMIDQHVGANDRVAAIEVVDPSSSQFLARREIYRNDFQADGTYQGFMLLFTSQAGQDLEFRTYWYGAAYIKEDFVAVAQ